MYEASGATWHADAEAISAAAAGLDKRQVNLCSTQRETEKEGEGKRGQQQHKGSATTVGKLFMRLRV